MNNTGFKNLKIAQMSDNLKKGVISPIENIGEQIKNIRETLGMTQKQLAKRVGVKQPVISRIEKQSENCSMRTVLKILNALNCRFSGFIMSKEDLSAFIEKAAEKKAEALLNRTYSNMAMEKQAPYKGKLNGEIEELKKELKNNPGPGLWDD